MANFFNYKAVYKNGHIEQEDGLLLWYLNGQPHVENQRKLADLRSKEASGDIVSLVIDYES